MKPFPSLALPFVFALLAVGTSARAEWNEVTEAGRVDRLCRSDRFSQLCLSGLLSFRCTSYTGGQVLSCVDTSRDAAALMDIVSTSEEGDVEFVAFAKELAWLMRQPYTRRYLTKLREKLETAFQTKEPFSLWDYSVYLTGGDRASALRLIGVVLQDTSHVKAPLYYLESLEKNPIARQTLDEYSYLLDLLEPHQLAKEKAETWLSLYPPELQHLSGIWSHKLYHFYTIGYLAMRLDWMTGERRLASFLPLILSSSYKFRRIAPQRWPRDPLPFDSKAEAGALTDIHAGYVGSLWSLGTRVEALLPRDPFANRLAAAPHAFMRSLIPKK